MRIKLRSKVQGSLTTVYPEFNKKLFMYLLPPAAKLLEFGGSKKGDRVHIKFGFPIFAQWISEITEDSLGEKTSYFIDEGRKLPFGLKKWRHKHLVHYVDEGHCVLEDDMYFSTGFIVTDLLLYPFLFLAFVPRVIQYKNYFGWPRRK